MSFRKKKKKNKYSDNTMFNRQHDDVCQIIIIIIKTFWSDSVLLTIIFLLK